MIRRVALLMLVVMVMALPVEAAKWLIDKPHSSMAFSVRHLLVSRTKGIFEDYTGEIEFDEKNLAGGTADFVAQVKSINTMDPKRDEHLSSPDFSDVQKFPIMTFVSTKVHDLDGNKFKLTGDLTIKDVTKEVTFECEFFGVAKDPMGNTKSGFSAESTINRRDFNLIWNMTLEGGGLVVGNDVTITLDL
ncbi:MAG: polyisoprenoid-binding protein, partial [candidate division Zixibacteria bacterium]|nr:polyisoprenoid-binding protein [candidate division Zixibacteria bacterium]